MNDNDRLANIIKALDRCEHGRHKQDPCFSCPGGQSTGNLFLEPGQRIGTDLGGNAIVVPPDWQLRTVPHYWLDANSHAHKMAQGPV